METSLIIKIEKQRYLQLNKVNLVDFFLYVIFDNHSYIIVHVYHNLKQRCMRTGSIQLQTMAVLSSFLSNLGFTVVVLLTILVLYVKYKRSYWQRRGVSTIPGHWLFGNIKEAALQKKSFAQVFGELYEQAADTDDVLGIYVLHKPFLLIRNPELIKQILIKDFNVFPNRYFSARSFHDDIGHTNLFSIQNPPWKYLRNKLSPIFTGVKLKKLFHLITQNADSMSKYMESQFLNGTKTKNIRLRDVALKYTTDIISNIAFGIEVNSFDPDKIEFFNKVQEGLKFSFVRGLQFSTMFFFPSAAKYVGSTMLGTSTDYFRRVFWDSMDTRESKKVKRDDLIDLLLELKNEKQENSEFKFAGDTLLSQSAIFFVAGRESSVSTICFTLAELAKQPEIQKRTRAEILEKLEQYGMTYEAVQNMKYLHQVISETLRLYPPAPILDRVSVEDYKIPGTDVVLEKGTPVYISLTGLHRDPKYYRDPLSFNPDRYTDENKNEIPPSTYIPFGEGPRVCIGTRLGQLQSAIGILTILKDYEVSYDSNCKCDIDIRNVFLSPVEDFRLNITKI